jgi:hypothetical protein
MASGLMNSSRQLGGCIGLAALATVAAHHTGASTAPAALNDGYALGLAIAAALFAIAAVVAIAVLPRRGTTTPGRRSTAPTENEAENELEGTSS